MKKIMLFVLASTLAIGAYYFVSKPAAAKYSKEMVVYKSKTCRCCNKWIDHMEKNGFKVTAHNVSDVDEYKNKFGVPINARSCHTAIVEGYFIEGHVPAQDVLHLLQNPLDVTGLAVPEMPVGTPGMEMGNRHDPYEVIAYSKDGSSTIYKSYR